MRSENHDLGDIQKTLQEAFPAVDVELRRDLWPDMLRRLDARPQKVPWYDWALAGGLAAAMVLFPKLVVLLAYHL